MTREKPRIINLKDLLILPLTIPPYQRPYRWSSQSALTMYNDLYSAFESKLSEYRIGTVVLHPENDSYNIIDGQQRLTTLSILMFCFYKKLNNSDYKKLSSLLNTEKEVYNTLSINAAVSNYKILNIKLDELNSTTAEEFLSYILEQCTVVKIETDTEQESFQFFDCQNSRGKELSPQDLLKAYHLRAMKDEKESSKIKIINNWEDTDQSKLEIFFHDNLYPLICYYKGKSGLNYSSEKIKIFKGIKEDTKYNFSLYHMEANKISPHYQLTQPLIEGKNFFSYTMYYFEMYKNIEKNYLFNEKYSKKYPILDSGSGNIYIHNLFINILMFFIDRFNYDSLTPSRYHKLYKWCYSLRLVMHSVYTQTIDKYALGNHDRANKGINLFNLISQMTSPEELDSILLDTIDKKQIYYTDKNCHSKIEKAIGVK